MVIADIPLPPGGEERPSEVNKQWLNGETDWLLRQQ